MTRGIETKDLIVGTGAEATKESVVVANVREFLRRGDEVSHSPLFGTRRVMNLAQRECIAGLRYGIPGMRVGGIREIVISPHLAYGEVGIPGKIPANALLRCEVELLEIRTHDGLLPQDWLPREVLILRRCRDEDDQQSGWTFTVNEGGDSLLSFEQANPAKQQPRWSQISILLNADESAELIRQALDLPKQIPADCVEWNSGFIDMQKGGSVITDNRNGARCMVLQVLDGGTGICLMGVHENSLEFLKSSFYQTIERLIGPHLGGDQASSTKEETQR